jgi:hypothetical protein
LLLIIMMIVNLPRFFRSDKRVYYNWKDTHKNARAKQSINLHNIHNCGNLVCAILLDDTFSLYGAFIQNAVHSGN